MTVRSNPRAFRLPTAFPAIMFPSSPSASRARRHHRHDLAAQVDDAEKIGRGVGHLGDVRYLYDLMNGIDLP
jgi:hypothetical protein